VNGGDILGSVTTELGLRFNLVALLPNTALALFVAALVRSGAASGAPDLDKLFPLPSAANLGLVTLAAVLLSLILHPFQLRLMRLFEGYWGDGRLGTTLGNLGVELHRRRCDRLDLLGRDPAVPESVIAHTSQEAVKAWRESVKERALEQRSSYPEDDDRLLPTRLGNILRAAEDSAGQRYGLDSVAFWPRLYPYIKGELADSLARVRDQLDLSVRMCATLIVATLVATGLLATDGWWLLVPATTAVLAWIAYRSALGTAAAYGEDVHVAFDLHRFDMLEAMRYPLPANLDEEREFNDQLTKFLQSGTRIGGDAVRHEYDHGQRKSEESDSAPGRLVGLFFWLGRRAGGRGGVERDPP
jgi:hypothetical protein